MARSRFDGKRRLNLHGGDTYGMKILQYTPQGHRTGCSRGRIPKLAVMAVTAALLGVTGLYLEASAPTEYEVKAAYLYNFGRFVRWPANARGNGKAYFPICVLGQDPFGRALDATIGGQSIDGKNVVARRILTPADALGCRVLFISSSEDGELKNVLSALDGTSVLTVSDMPQFTRRGGMICLITQHNRIRFEVNLAAAERVGLMLSSQLLKLAVSVDRNFQPGTDR